MFTKSSILLFLLASLLFVISGCKNSKKHDQDKLIIFHAGSLSVPLKQISAEFQKENPTVEIFAEAAGSVACARKITDLNRPCDVMLSADHNVIDKFLIPGHAGWSLQFASNEMVIAFNEKSLHAAEINRSNWPEILTRKKVRYGRSDPNSDPCGYRTVMCLELADQMYDFPELAQSLLNKDIRYIRPKETDLLALLETHTIDYIFIYKSVAAQHQLKYITLSDSVNLNKPDHAEWYKNAVVKINGEKPGEKITQQGEPMIYGLTIPANSPNKELAVKYVAFLLNKDKGMKIMEQNGQPSLVPSPSQYWQNIPADLQQFALPVK
jgi:molybdate/tungstate transport system substrate-binding protein